MNDVSRCDAEPTNSQNITNKLCIFRCQTYLHVHNCLINDVSMLFGNMFVFIKGNIMTYNIHFITLPLFYNDEYSISVFFLYKNNCK